MIFFCLQIQKDLNKVFKMERQQQLQQFRQQKNNNSSNTSNDEQQPQIGTEILDPTLPSDLDFDNKHVESDHQHEEVKFDNALHLTQPFRKSSLDDVGLLQSYTVKGKSIYNLQPKYERGRSISHVVQQLFQVKIFDEQKTSTGFKRFWQSVVGYVKRETAFSEGYFYIFERRNDGLLVSNSWKLNQLFKIFIDEEESKIRFVFTEDERIVTKDMGVVNIKHTMEKLLDELKKVGLRLEGQA